MKRTFASISAIAAIAIAAVSRDVAPDAIVMTVGSRPVTVSEFEYLYNKNAAQLDSAITLEEYAGMFADFKRKVLEAEACGLDTSATYLADMDRFSRELARPYFWDRDMADSLSRVLYSHMTENVEITHIALPLNASSNVEAVRRLADSICCVASSGADFAALAREYSAQHTDGYLGFISSGRMPYAIEEVVYDTPVGKCGVAATPYGFFVIKVLSRRPDVGRVKVRHILKLTQGLDSVGTARARQQIDSLYHLAVAPGADFAALASANTDDPSGRNNGGDLDWFGAGVMVPAFEQTAFALADGTVSEPFLTPYGYHIILKEGSGTLPAFEDMEQSLQSMVKDGELSSRVVVRSIAKMRGAAGFKLNKKVDSRLRKLLKKSKGYCGDAIVAIAADSSVLATVAGHPVTMAELSIAMPKREIPGVDEAYSVVSTHLYELVDAYVAEWMIRTMGDREPAYANTLREYSDGMLLFEICQQRVWNRPNTDTSALEAYYQAHTDDYRWDKPHYRGMVLLALNDSIADAAVAYLDTLPHNTPNLSAELRKRFSTNVKLETVLAARGDNALIDYIAFSGEKPDMIGGRWTAFRQFRGEIVDQPTCVADVKTQVSIDFQQQLEAEFLEYLRARYPAVIDYSILQSL